jgi:pimeloyl-ACP methyl ester carboxylesterase
VNLSTHIADVRNLIIYQDLAEVILVGNSYAGMVITGVAAAVPERIKMLVYLDAYIPEDGQCETDLWPAARKAAAAGALKDGLIQPPPTTIFGITDPELLKWVNERVTAHPASTYTEPVPAGNAQSRALPGTFIRCTRYPSTIADVFEQFVAKARQKGWAVHELATGHLAMVSAPQELSKLLLDISRNAS